MASQEFNPEKFFPSVRISLFDGRLTQSQVDGINFILSEWEKNWQERDLRCLAYALATTFHETARTMQPIEEFGKGSNYPYGKRRKMTGEPYSDYSEIYYGRGFVQLTWYENYQKAGEKLGYDFLSDPSLVMVPDVAAEILLRGMFEGWFTGRKLSSFFTSEKTDWVGARTIINGTDKAAMIGDYAKKFYSALSLP